MRQRKIIGVTAARSEYDLMYPVYKRLNDDQNIDFGLIITGPHLSPTYGLTKQQVLNDGFKVFDTCFNLIDSDEKIARVIGIGNQIPLLAQCFYREQPDLILIAGDREDVMSTCLSAAYMAIPVAHFFGGDIAKDGNIDNSVRYAASKLANIHFTTLDEHALTLKKLGEDQWRIHVVGNPALDRFLTTKSLGKRQLLECLGLGHLVNDQFGVVIKHSIISQVDLQEDQMKKIFEALLTTDLFYLVNYPNSDPGSLEIRKIIDVYCETYPEKFFKFKNLDREIYVNLLRHASVLVGNSSSGLLEAPSLKLPVVNVGMRQRGRVHGENVIFVDHDDLQITQALNKCLKDQDFLKKVRSSKNPYGQGDSAEKVHKIICDLNFTDELIFKNITY
jgi:GDP/UDP-N,N'-diacetylbacillosamine 2-epimerase (hydrolysing)